MTKTKICAIIESHNKKGKQLNNLIAPTYLAITLDGTKKIPRILFKRAHRLTANSPGRRINKAPGYWIGQALAGTLELLKNNRSCMEYNKDTWDKVMALKTKDTKHRGVANTLIGDEIDTILGTAHYFGCDGELKQIYFDLWVARYRVFDWLAMCVMGRMENRTALKVLVHSFLKADGDIDKFIEDLRYTDYEVDNSWQATKV